MGKHAAIRKSAPEPVPFASEARASLAASISISEQAKRHQTETKEVYHRLNVMVWDAQRRLETATSAVAEANEMLPAHTATGASVLGDRLVKNALAAETEARDAIPALVEQRNEAKLILDDAEFKARKAAEAVPRAAHVVVAEEIGRLLTEAIAAQQVLAQKRLALRGAVNHARDPWKEDPRVEEADAFLSELGLPDMDPGSYAHPISRRWAGYFEQLQEDANTPAPVAQG